MGIVNTKDLIEMGLKNKMIIPAFNAHNIEMCRSILEAAEEENYPVIIQSTPKSVELSSYKVLYSVVNELANKKNVTCALHLDHGKTFDNIKNAVFSGFNSVMIDGSMLEYQENVNLTKETAEFAHTLGVIIEAELGEISGKEDDNEVKNQNNLTSAELVEDFHKKTKCDMLAVSIGNSHGLEKKELDFELLKEIRKKTDVPLVIHGGSGIGENDLKYLKEYKIVKINFSSELKQKMIEAYGKVYMSNNNEYDIVTTTNKVLEEVKKVVKNKIRILKSN